MPPGNKRRKGRIAAQAGPPAKRQRRRGQGSDRPQLEEISRSLEDPDEFQLPNTWIREWVWLVLLGAGIVAFALAIYAGDGYGWPTIADALRLFPSGFPGNDASAPTSYVVASHLAAAVTLFATAGLVWIALRGRFERLQARFARDHVVVIGLGEKGLRIGRGFRARGRSVTCLTLDSTGDAADDLRARGTRVISGDATQWETLRAARVDLADTVVCACGADSVNAQIAAQLVHRRRNNRGPSSVYAHVANPELAHVLRTTALRLEDVHLHFFNIYATWARALLKEGPLGTRVAGVSDPPRIAVIGASELARALVVRACRRWHFHVGKETTGRLRVLVVAADSREFCDGITARYPALSRTSELVPVAHGASVRDPSALAQLGDDLSAVYICLSDDGEALGVALQARYQLGPEGPAVLIPASPWTRGLRGLLVPQQQRITIVRYPLADSLDLLRDTLRESLARAVHLEYLEARRDEFDWQKRPADVDWEDLDESARRASRRHVDHMLEQLESLWYEVAPLFDWDEPPVELGEEQVDLLARLEHERWCREQAAAGRVYGTTRTDRHHPLLVSWHDLPAVDAELDRDLARRRPSILARAGYRIVHVPEREMLARLVHTRFVERRAADSHEDAALPPWELLSAEQRELNRSAVDDIAIKLLKSGYRLERHLEPADSVVFPPDVVERLAEREHDRWCRIRLEYGWRYGEVRDDEQRLHPDLVPWYDLPEHRRQLDREQVLQIPSLLAAVGFGAVRLEEPWGAVARVPITTSA